jgi:hypothetical protein
MTSLGRRDKDCVPDLAFNRFTSTFLYGSYDEEVVFIEPIATEEIERNFSFRMSP